MTETLAPEVAPAELAGSLHPYPGPRPFHLEERQLFFGRDREQSQLRSIVLANTLVLLYAESGAGKTSLIHAGLVPALVRRGATVFPVLRIRPSGDEEFRTRITNPYVRSLAANWAAAAAEGWGRAESPATLLEHVANVRDLVALLGCLQDAPSEEPRVLIIDQFEELFTYFPEHWQARGDLFSQLEDALAGDPDLRVLLSMREDYISQTDPFAALVSNHLQQRLRIATLDRKQALSAVTCPLTGTGRRFAPGAAEHLVDQLLQIRIERNGRLETVPGEFVEPVQLQVVCQRLWEELPPGVSEITREAVERSGDVDEVLENFYDDAIRDAAATDRHLRERTIRDWIEKSLITSLGTRGTSHRDEARKKGVPQGALDELVNNHLLRSEYRNGSDWYELTHDRLIGPIQGSNSQFRDAAVKRRLRAASAVALVLAAAWVFVLLTRPFHSTTTVTKSSPGAPTIAVPVNGGLYRRGTRLAAVYSCARTRTWTLTGCVASTPPGAPIDTSVVGPHVFTVTASYGRSAILTTRRVTYSVVDFQTSVRRFKTFSIAVPVGWRMSTGKSAGYADTSFEPEPDGGMLLEVNVHPGVVLNLQRAALSYIAKQRSLPGYRERVLRYVKFGTLKAIDWVADINSSGGTRLRFEVVFFNDAAKDAAFVLLTAATARRYPQLRADFAALRGTLTIKDERELALRSSTSSATTTAGSASAGSRQPPVAGAAPGSPGGAGTFGTP